MTRAMFRLPALCCALVLLAGVAVQQLAVGQIVQQAVGGVAVDAEGVLRATTQEDSARLRELRNTAINKAPAELQAWTDLRSVSLKQLEAQLAESAANGSAIPEEVRYLAGLQRLQYVFVYPEQNDIVIAGPAEGWELDELGNAVGATSRRPVLLLDDLMVALRTRESSRLEAISCSIDPTAEGIKRLRAAMSRVRKMGRSSNNQAKLRAGPRTADNLGDRRPRVEPLRSHPRGCRLPHEAFGHEL